MEKAKKPEQYAIDFLLFSYFEVDLTDNVEDMIDKAIEKAYRDATQQGAYNTLVKDNKEASKEAQKSACKRIKNSLDNLPPKEEYNEWHAELCKKITTEDYKKLNGIFSYGNAQKWVNMTMKYLYIFHGLMQFYNPAGDFEKNYGKKIESLISVLHVPVDRYIMQAASDELHIDIPYKPDENKNDKKGSYKEGKVKPWSKWNYDEYKKFQDDIRNAVICPIDWEGPAWIKVAQKRKVK